MRHLPTTTSSLSGTSDSLTISLSNRTTNAALAAMSLEELFWGANAVAMVSPSTTRVCSEQ